MIVKTVTPSEAQELMNNGSTLIDIREPAEFLREHVPGAHSFPLSDIVLGKSIKNLPIQHPVIFHCLAGSRTTQNAEALVRAAAPVPVLLLSGGINAWKSANLPTVEDKKTAASDYATSSNRSRNAHPYRSPDGIHNRYKLISFVRIRRGGPSFCGYQRLVWNGDPAFQHAVEQD